MKRLILAGLVVAMLAPPGAAGAYGLSDELADVNRRIDDLNNQMAAVNASRTTVVADIIATRDDLELRQAELAVTEDELVDIELQLAERRGALDALREVLQESYQDLAETRNQLDDSKQQARDWVQAAYIGSSDGRETVAFAADSVTGVYVGLEYLSLLAADTDRAILLYDSLQTQEERQQVRIEAKEVEVGDRISELETVESDLVELVSAQEAKAEAVSADLAALAARLDQVDEDIADFAVELDGLEKEQARVEQLIEEEASNSGTAPGILVRPVPGAITSSFGMRFHPILGYPRMHTGVDMRASHGQAIKAGAAGRVILAGVYGGYGNTVIIDHGGGMTTLYAHQSQLNVSYDQSVGAGDTIGLVGTSGLSTGPHLHFEVRLSGVPVNPADYL